LPNVVNGLYVDVAAKSRVDRAWRAFVRDEATDFAEAAYQGKRMVMKSALAGGAHCACKSGGGGLRVPIGVRAISRSIRCGRAIAEVVADFSVYRTYIVDQPSGQDRHYVDLATAQATRRSTAADLSIFNFVRDLFLVRPPADGDPEPDSGVSKLRDARPAVHRAGHGQGSRGHRILRFSIGLFH
jgi:(1->4)-alpha-D-glucan 1-alpha-D-glucosylmutase